MPQGSVTSHTVRVAIIIEGHTPKICVVRQTGTRKYRQKDGSLFKEKDRYGLPGGRMEELDETFIDTAIREVLEETGIRQEWLGGFSENLSIHFPPSISKRASADLFQEHFYLLILKEVPPGGGVREKEEIVDVKFLLLDNLPSPKDEVPFGYKHLTGLSKLLRKCAPSVPHAEEWAKTIEEQLAFCSC